MCPDHKAQQGFSIITAIFLVVVMALLAVGMVKILATGQQGISQEITSLRSYLAAQSGLQVGMYQAVYAAPANGAVHNPSFAATGLTNTTVTTSYQSDSIDGATYFLINTRADYAGLNNPEYSRREMELRFRP
ncbi:MAG: hypothetical protein PVJ63_03835 [Thioalkalispiraceae bacterium]|jgi:Tfp pilus assembly protein PilX